ncbi:thioredoxin family protein [Hyphomicrobium sp.]|uniref:thioredoxin family protein n=1 Tax=Hyphomicrobium sp. TaxID=82 RepID=UPI0025BF5A89|nr:thioredoxin family protein [Hyphomicrobium sp.]MCC7251702.1 thioredoxin family protein [Hyphomicrobium sp.]
MSMRSIPLAVLRCLGLGLLAVLPPAAGSAAPEHEMTATGQGPTGVELIAFEAPDCIYCPVFRRDVAPSYAASRAGKAAPLRFVDLNDATATRLKLAGPVTMVPTLVLVRDGIEIGRIAGYVGRESMHRLLHTMLPSE